jgi:(p)ppGpp synthase/HD superfamily hydrolase
MKININKELDKAIKLAVEVHAGTFDKGGHPYILHPLHVMNNVMFDKGLAVIAVLHDVVEDSHYTIEDLTEMGFTKRTTDALVLLTHLPEDSYETYIEKIATSYDAIRVKRKDLEHNSDITRLKGLRPKDFERLEKYMKAFKFLGDVKRKNFVNTKED